MLLAICYEPASSVSKGIRHLDGAKYLVTRQHDDRAGYIGKQGLVAHRRRFRRGVTRRSGPVAAMVRSAPLARKPVTISFWRAEISGPQA